MEQTLHDHFCGVFGTATSTRMTINFTTLQIVPLPLDELDVDIHADEAW
jgi:hypothetical protein